MGIMNTISEMFPKWILPVYKKSLAHCFARENVLKGL